MLTPLLAYYDDVFSILIKDYSSRFSEYVDCGHFEIIGFNYVFKYILYNQALHEL